MRILENIQQGSDDWLSVRAKFFCASEAPAMMGTSTYTSRNELLRKKATGFTKEVDEATQRRFDRGHEVEALARHIVEQELGESLYPVTGVVEVEGMNLLASFDGLMMDDRSWENKLLNASLLSFIQENNDLPDSHWPQPEHQMIVSGGDGVYFTVSDGTEEGTHGFWYESRPERRAAVLAGWHQFAEDLANYQHREVPAPVVVAPIEDLPALVVELTGAVTNSNLAVFQSVVTKRIQGINTDLKTDEDFAVAEKMVKFLDDGEKRIDLVKGQALAQTASIDTLFRTLDTLKAEMRAKRLTLDKLVKSQKDSRRNEIMQAGKDALAAYIAGLNASLGHAYMPAIVADFAGAMKSKRTIASLQDAVDTELARAKVEAKQIAERINTNLNTLRELAEGHAHLFPDAAQIVSKATDDLVALIKTRIADESARMEQERQRVRAEEERKAREAAEAAERQRIAQEAASAEAKRREEEAERQRKERLAKQARDDLARQQREAAQALAAAEEAKRKAEEVAAKASANKVVADAQSYTANVDAFLKGRHEDDKTKQHMRPWLMEYSRYLDAQRQAALDALIPRQEEVAA